MTEKVLICLEPTLPKREALMKKRPRNKRIADLRIAKRPPGHQRILCGGALFEQHENPNRRR